MKIFENKSVFKKLIIVLISILVISFLVPNIVRAEDGGIGGKLLDPLMSLFVGLGDGAITLLQKIILQTDASIIQVDTGISTFQAVLGAIVCVAILVGGIVAIVASGGGAVLAVAGAVVKVITGGVVAGVVTYAASGYIANAVLPEEFALPEIGISPYEIFSNQIALFDIDFFNPNDEKKEITNTIENLEKIDEISTYNYSSSQNISGILKKMLDEMGKENNLITDLNSLVYKGDRAVFTEGNDKYVMVKEGSINSTIGEKYILYKDNSFTTNNTLYASSAYNLRPVISNWYTALRNISLVALLSVLVYTGIRIVISSTANDKSKYKQMLVDWVIAICLLFVMHYIMAFSNMIVEKITELVDSTKVVTQLPDGVDGQISSDGAVAKEGVQLFKIDDPTDVSKAYEVLVKSQAEEKHIAESETQFYDLFKYEDGKKILYWPADNFTEQARMMLQFVDEKDGVNNYAYASIGWKLIYCVLVIYTFIFALTYLKRLVYMTFLTLVAPLVALTYPIDKMNDGKAQAFDKWLKEYIFNLLIQPLHLLLYMILIGSAMSFAAQNIFYVIVALGFMTQGEKLLRSFFGFEKAHTPGILGGPAGAAVMMSGINKLLSGSSKKDGKGGKGADGSSGVDKGINYKNDLSTSALFAASDDNKPEESTNIVDKNEQITDNTSLDSSNYEDSEDNQKWDYLMGIADNSDNTIKNQDFNDIVEDSDYDPSMNFVDSLVDENDYDTNGNYIGEQVEDNLNNTGKWESFKANVKDKKDRSIRGFANVGNRLILKAENEQPLRKLAKVGTGALAAAAIMPAAGMAAIVDGEGLGKSSQIIGGAALAGYKAGAGIPSEVMEKRADAKANMEAFKEGYYGQKEYREQKIKENIEKMQKDIKLREELVRRLESEEAADRAINKVAPQCVEYGLGKANEIATVAKLMESGESQNRALMLTKTVKKYGQDTSSLGNEASEDLDKTIMKQVRKNSGSNVSEKQIRKHVTDLRKDYDTASKIFYQKL